MSLAGGRGPRAVAASILAVALIGVYFLASGESRGFQPVFLIHASVLALGFWFPAMKLSTPAEVLGAWRALLPWLLGWTLVWDLATAGVVGGRALFERWWLVYPAGVLTFLALLLVHVAAVRRWRPRAEP